MSKTVVLGGGIAGLSAAHVLTKNKKDVMVIEKDDVVGGLSKTINYKGFRFDLGGHRFLTKNEEAEKFFKKVVGNELVTVPRVSRILLNKRFFDYPLKPTNALFGMGILKSFQIIGDYSFTRIKNIFKPRKDVSFEDWIINRFGNTMYSLYFKPYTEKVWQIPCTKLSADWAAQRIKGMSLREAIKNSLFKSKDAPKSLTKEFLFPRLGIGRFSDRMAKNIKNINLNSRVIGVKHKNNKITSVEYIKNKKKQSIKPGNLLSSMPVTELIFSLNPKAPKEIIKHAKNLKYINEIFVLIVVNKDFVTKDSWLYFPDKDISFVRIHEPKNWSKDMAKPGKTAIVAEYICKENSKRWKDKDKNLVKMVIADLKKLKFIKEKEVIGSCVVRNKKTYPIYDVGYSKHLNIIKEYLKKFKNLQIMGRNGSFRYANIDHSIEMGVKAAKNLMGGNYDIDKVGKDQEYLEQKT